MKHILKKHWLTILTVFVLILLLPAAYLKGKANADPPPYQPLTLEAAKAAHAAYYSQARAPEAAPHSFTLNIDQYYAMGSILGSEPQAAGFRLYFASDKRGNPMMVVMGINASGADLVDNIYATSVSQSGLCPTICDENSPMVTGGDQQTEPH